MIVADIANLLVAGMVAGMVSATIAVWFSPSL